MGHAVIHDPKHRRGDSHSPDLDRAVPDPCSTDQQESPVATGESTTAADTYQIQQ